MTTLATGLIGAAVGGVIGAPGFGFSLGAAVGQSFLGGKGQHTYTHQEGSRLSDLKVQSSQVGMMIPLVYGTYRIAGNIIWSTDILEHSNTTTQTQHLGGGGKGGHHHDNVMTQTTTTYSYSISFALGLCQGVILGIRRIWADGKLIYNTSSTATAQTLVSSQLRAKQLRLYKGTDDQLPDPLMEAHLGAGNVPAFRDLAYLVFEDLQLSEFGNRLPNITVEVVQVGEHTKNLSHVAIQIEKPLSDAVGNLSYFDNGVIHTQLAGEGLNQPPERVDLDLNLNVIQRWRGANTQGQRYQSIIKYMPNLFLKSAVPCAWYDITIGQHAPVEPYVGEPLTGVYANGHVYCIYGSRTHYSHAHLIHYQVGSPYDIPKTVVAKIMGLQQTFNQPFAKIVDVDMRHGYLFATSMEQQTPTLFVVDPVSSKLVKKWTLQLANAPFDFRYPLRNHYYIALNSDSSKALLTHQDGNLSQAFLVALDFDADTLTADPNETYCFEGNGHFHFLTDDLVYVGGLANPPTVTKANLRGIHAVEPSKLLLTDLIDDLCCQKTAIAKELIDLTQLKTAEQTVDGFVLSQSTTLRECLLPLQQAYHFDIVESGFTLQFVTRNTEQKPINIDQNDLGAQEPGQAANSSWIETHSQTAELPQCVHVLFTDSKNNYQQGYQSAKRSTIQNQQTQTIELPLALSNDQAVKIANTLLYEACTARTHYEFTLSRKYAYLDPGDLVHLNNKILRLTRVAYGNPGLVKIKAVNEDPSIYQSTRIADASSSTQTDAEIHLSSPTQLYLLDIPILHDEDDDTGFYTAVSHLLPHWPGAVIAESKDNGQTFKALYSQNYAATVGITQNALSTGKTTAFNEESTLIVKLSQGELSSTTELNVLNGENLCLVGQEILQFQNAILQPDGCYQLSRLLRGRHGTEWAVNSHQSIECFILLNSHALHRIKSSAAHIGLNRIYKAITFGGNVTATIPYSFINTAVGKKPLNPVHLQGSRNEADDLILTWIPRTRIQGAWRDSVDTPRDPEITGYEIQIVKEQETLRILASTTETIIYTAEQQIADFGSIPTTITIKLYAIGKTVGRGSPLEATL